MSISQTNGKVAKVLPGTYRIANETLGCFQAVFYKNVDTVFGANLRNFKF